jgi:predicted  nucleic acid-binding Zn ribbon protein
LLRKRYEAATFWTFAVLAALIEPLEKSVLLRKWALFGDTPMEQAMNLEAIAWQVVYAVLLRRFGWAAPILARFGYYLVVRCFHQ